MNLRQKLVAGEEEKRIQVVNSTHGKKLSAENEMRAQDEGKLFWCAMPMR
jgi:hypothetical protein